MNAPTCIAHLYAGPHDGAIVPVGAEIPEIPLYIDLQSVPHGRTFYRLAEVQEQSESFSSNIRRYRYRWMPNGPPVEITSYHL